MKKGNIILLFFLLLASIKIQAQSQSGTWWSISADKELNKKWGIEAGTELRTIYFLRLINRWTLGAGINYKIAKPIKFGIGYQMMNVLDEKYLNYQIRHRFKADLSGRLKWNDLSFGLTEGAQLTTKNDSKRINDDGTINTYAINPALVWKNALTLEYNIPKSKLTPGYEFETFYQLNNPDGNQFDKIRNMLYFKYKINKHNSIKAFGLINQELGSDEADYSGKYILGFGYTYHFK